MLREVVWLMLLHDISSNYIDDYDDGQTQTSKIRFLALARNQLVNIKCKATNSHGSVEQEHSSVIQCKDYAGSVDGIIIFIMFRQT